MPVPRLNEIRKLYINYHRSLKYVEEARIFLQSDDPEDQQDARLVYNLFSPELFELKEALSNHFENCLKRTSPTAKKEFLI